jgi:hypothetical protein
MVGQGDQPHENTAEEIQQEAKEEIARAARLVWDAKRGKRHNDLQNDSGAYEDEPRDGAPSRRHHPKFKSWCPADRE